MLRPLSKLINVGPGTGVGNRIRVQLPVRDILSRYVASHPGQLKNSTWPTLRAMSTSQRALMPCGWGVKAGTCILWFVCGWQVKLCDSCMQGHREFPFGNSREFPGIATPKIPGGNSREFLKFWRELRGISRVLSFFEFLLLIMTFLCLI